MVAIFRLAGKPAVRAATGRCALVLIPIGRGLAADLVPEELRGTWCFFGIAMIPSSVRQIECLVRDA